MAGKVFAVRTLKVKVVLAKGPSGLFCQTWILVTVPTGVLLQVTPPSDEYKIVVFAITHWSQQGRGKGTLTIPHGGALWMRIKPTTFEVLKARPPWSGKQGVYPRPFLKPGQTWPGQEVK